MCKSRFLVAALAAGVLVAFAWASDASAQYPYVLAPGPIIRYDLYGNQHLIYPSAMAPGAGIVMPGSYRQWNSFVPGRGWASGASWIGADGRWHGQSYVPGPNGGSYIQVYRPQVR